MQPCGLLLRFPPWIWVVGCSRWRREARTREMWEMQMTSEREWKGASDVENSCSFLSHKRMTTGAKCLRWRYLFSCKRWSDGLSGGNDRLSILPYLDGVF